VARHRFAVALLVVIAAARLMQAAALDQRPTSTGLLPVYDASGEGVGEIFAQHLTSAIYATLSDAGREPVLLNPGGRYNLIDEAGTLEYARSAGVRIALITALKQTKRTKPSDEAPRLQIEIRAVDATSGAVLQTFSLSEEVKRKDLERGFDFGNGRYQVRLSPPGSGLEPLDYYSMTRSSKRLKKQPLGKAVLRIADTIRDQVLAHNGGALMAPAAATSQGSLDGACDVDLRVQYIQQRSSSKAFAVFVNDRDESTTVKDGVASFTARAGLLFLEVSVSDPPFRLPIQRSYAINRWLDCSPSQRHLIMEIGGGGEALMVVRP
jgi:hypothetical protein